MPEKSKTEIKDVAFDELNKKSFEMPEEENFPKILQEQIKRVQETAKLAPEMIKNANKVDELTGKEQLSDLAKKISSTVEQTKTAVEKYETHTLEALLNEMDKLYHELGNEAVRIDDEQINNRDKDTSYKLNDTYNNMKETVDIIYKTIKEPSKFTLLSESETNLKEEVNNATKIIKKTKNSLNKSKEKLEKILKQEGQEDFKDKLDEQDAAEATNLIQDIQSKMKKDVDTIKKIQPKATDTIEKIKDVKKLHYNFLHVSCLRSFFDVHQFVEDTVNNKENSKECRTLAAALKSVNDIIYPIDKKLFSIKVPETNEDQLQKIIDKHHNGFDVPLGDISKLLNDIKNINNSSPTENCKTIYNSIIKIYETLITMIQSYKKSLNKLLTNVTSILNDLQEVPELHNQLLGKISSIVNEDGTFVSQDINDALTNQNKLSEQKKAQVKDIYKLTDTLQHQFKKIKSNIEDAVGHFWHASNKLSQNKEYRTKIAMLKNRKNNIAKELFKCAIQVLDIKDYNSTTTDKIKKTIKDHSEDQNQKIQSLMDIIKTYQNKLVKALPTLNVKKETKSNFIPLKQLGSVDTILKTIDKKLLDLKKLLGTKSRLMRAKMIIKDTALKAFRKALKDDTDTNKSKEQKK